MPNYETLARIVEGFDLDPRFLFDGRWDSVSILPFLSSLGITSLSARVEALKGLANAAETDECIVSIKKAAELLGVRPLAIHPKLA